jgi:hypothetical protein
MFEEEKHMTDRELLELALRKAFNLGSIYWQQVDSEFSSNWKKGDVTKAQLDQLIEDTIKQALAAPVQDTDAHYKGVVEGVKKLFDNKRAQPAPVQPKPEYKFCDDGKVILKNPEILSQRYRDTTPPAAQPAVPITESEIEKMWFQQADFPTAGQRIVGFARAIEAKLKEKNSD